MAIFYQTLFTAEGAENAEETGASDSRFFDFRLLIQIWDRGYRQNWKSEIYNLESEITKLGGLGG
jgi:hypothetical protein